MYTEYLPGNQQGTDCMREADLHANGDLRLCVWIGINMLLVGVNDTWSFILSGVSCITAFRSCVEDILLYCM